MKSTSYRRPEDGKAAKAFLKVFLPLVGVVLVGGGAWLKIAKFEGEKPVVVVAGDARVLGTELAFAASDKKSGLAEVSVEAIQKDQTISLLVESLPPLTASVERKIALRPLPAGLAEGEVRVRVRAKDRSWNGGNKTVVEKAMVIDTRPPRPMVLGGPHYVNQGGTGYVAFTTTEPAAKAGLMIGEQFYPAYATGPNRYAVFFPLLPDTAPTAIFRVVSEDAAGNRGDAEFKPNVKPKAFASDRVELTDKFLGNVIPYFKDNDPSLAGSDIDIFLQMNRDQRAKDAAVIQKLCRETGPKPLWSGAFLRLPDSGPMASFAQKRTYFYQGKEVDRQTHMGVDLASLQNSPVPAANAGRVVYADRLGIYGNTVVLDHGCGLLSMYSHLSGFNVEVGKEVAKGDVLGRTGSTGMAGGDHLHFAILVQGVFVNPVEWWDEHWIKDNVTIKML